MTIRLGPNPPPTSTLTTKVMRSNRGRNTGPEVAFRKALRAEGVRGYRLHWKKVPGRPDIAFPGLKLAIFVFGCYWHRCQRCELPLPKSNTSFWSRKFDLNKERDRRKRMELGALGWEVVEVWECEIKDSPDSCVSRVRSARYRLTAKRNVSRRPFRIGVDSETTTNDGKMNDTALISRTDV